jgi:hypothetical protein
MHMSYAVVSKPPLWPSAERYLFFLSFFVFALCERKNEKQ